MELKSLLFEDAVYESARRYLEKPNGALLLQGPNGLGKHLLAQYMAMELLGTDNLAAHPDFMEIVAQSQVIKIEEISHVHKAAACFPAAADRKVFLIDGADLMTLQAQNSLLKLLEDRNERNIIIMVCGGPILPTIRSRCHAIEIFPLAEQKVREYLGRNGDEADELSLSLAGGCIGRYYSYLERKDFLSEIRNFFSAFSANSVMSMLCSFSMIREKDKGSFAEKYEIGDIRAFMQLLYEVLTELLIHAVWTDSGRSRFSEFVDFDMAGKCFSATDILRYQKVIRGHFERSARKGAYTKNDFFDLIRSL